MEPLAAIIALLQPRTVFAKIISGAGPWGVRYPDVRTVGFGLVLKGDCYLSGEGFERFRLSKGSFVLMPPTRGFIVSSSPEVVPVEFAESTTQASNEIRHGIADGEPEFRLLGGYFWFDPANASLLRGLVPSPVCIREAETSSARLINTMALLTDEALGDRPGRDLIVSRLVEVMLVEALRHRSAEIRASDQPGLLQGLADSNLARALRHFHDNVSHRWTVGELARAAGLSRSAFSNRFVERMGITPMQYVMQWRMAVARNLLQQSDASLEAIAEAIGYASASAFSTAFRRETGRPPSHFLRPPEATRRD